MLVVTPHLAIGICTMNEKDYLDFLAALGQEFCHCLSPAVGFENIEPQNAFEVFRREFKIDPSPTFLALLSDSQVERLRAGFEKFLECDGISVIQVREAVTRTLARWPATDDSA